MEEFNVPLTEGELEMQASIKDPISKFKIEWEQMKHKPSYVQDWLLGQYRGEIDAVASMEALLETFGNEPRKGKLALLVERVIQDEHKHVELIGELLISRGVKPRPPETTKVLPGMEEWGKGCAVASRAEAIRAGEIRVVLADSDVPEDVKQVFSRILKEEAFHEKAFRSLAGDKEMKDHIEFIGWDRNQKVEWDEV